MHSLRGLLAWVTLAFLGSRVVFQDLKDWLAWRFPASVPACSRRPSTKGGSAFCFRNYSDCSLDKFTDPLPLYLQTRLGGSAGWVCGSGYLAGMAGGARDAPSSTTDGTVHCAVTNMRLYRIIAAGN